MKLYDFEYILIEYYGEIGTSRRDQFERRVDETYTLTELVKLSCNRTSPKNNWVTVWEWRKYNVPYQKGL